jgi:hypothetical protein
MEEAMPTYAYNPPFLALISGKIDYAIIERQGGYIPWSRTREHPWCADRAGALASIRDMLSADGYKRFNRLTEKQISALY